MNVDPEHDPARSTRFAEALERFDAENARDPNTVVAGGQTWPRELLQARRLYDWVLRLQPNASEPLRLATRCQHIARWQIPRNQFPMDRPGYLKWRSELKKFHARKARQILESLGYPEETVAVVEALNLKRNFPHDPDCRVLEDALCLVFLEHQLAELAQRSAEDKILNALRKSWEKMTPQAQELARQLPLGPAGKELLAKALAGT